MLEISFDKNQFLSKKRVHFLSIPNFLFQRNPNRFKKRLECEEDQEGPPQSEQSDSFCKSESEDAQTEEFVLFVWVTSNSLNKRREDGSDSNSHSCQRNCCETSTNKLCSNNHLVYVVKWKEYRALYTGVRNKELIPSQIFLNSKIKRKLGIERLESLTDSEEEREKKEIRIHENDRMYALEPQSHEMHIFFLLELGHELS